MATKEKEVEPEISSRKKHLDNLYKDIQGLVDKKHKEISLKHSEVESICYKLLR